MTLIPVRTRLRFKTLALRKSSYCVSNLPCFLHWVGARPQPGRWDPFSVAQGRKLTSSLLQKRQGFRWSLARVETASFDEHLLNTYYVWGTVWDTLHFILVFDIHFSPVILTTSLLVTAWWGSWPIWNGWRNWLSKKLCELAKVQRRWSSNSGLLAPNPCVSCSTTSTSLYTGPSSFSVETGTAAFSPFQLAVPIKAPYSGWALRIPLLKREARLLLSPEGFPLETGTVQGFVISECPGHQDTSVSFSLTPVVKCYSAEAGAQPMFPARWRG